MKEEARRAGPDDLARITQLFVEATAELRPEKGGEVWARQTARDRGPSFDLDDAGQLVLAGTIDASIVGYARALAEPLADGGELAVITDIYVERGAREVSLGELLLGEVIAWATARGCIGVDAIALPGMRASKNFFEAAGLVARQIVVHKALP
ncbi:MAG: GNAT family N-acetyltransferase [Acidimicrobiia bacterium]|nr:GNAT family N-acetyltransferase [Acidimicrobiia bacterium]